MPVHALRPTYVRPNRVELVPRPNAVPADCVSADREDFRQLRHLTKNALQRILSIIESQPGDDYRARRMSDDLQRRILVAAAVSDALFGMTREPGTLQDRLTELSRGLVALLAEDAAAIKVIVTVQCSPGLEESDLILRVAHELVGNAVKHGMHERLLGKVQIDVREEAEWIVLAVVDDGWGCTKSDQIRGEGLAIVDSLLQRAGGTHHLRRNGDRTVATARIPR